MAARRAAPAPRPAAHCSRTPSGADLCAMRRPNPQWAAGRSLRGQRGRVHDAVIVRRTRGRVEVCRWSATGSRQQARCVPRPRPAAGSGPGRRGRPRPCAPALRHVNVTVHRDIYTRKKGPESLRDLDFKISEILPKRVGVRGEKRTKFSCGKLPRDVPGPVFFKMCGVKSCIYYGRSLPEDLLCRRKA